MLSLGCVRIKWNKTTRPETRIYHIHAKERSAFHQVYVITNTSPVKLGQIQPNLRYHTSMNCYFVIRSVWQRMIIFLYVFIIIIIYSTVQKF